MNEFGPWMFATAVLVSLTYVFVNVPGSRRWFGISIAALLAVVVLSVAAFHHLDQQKNLARSSELLRFGKADLTVDGQSFDDVYVLLDQDTRSVVEMYVGPLPDEVLQGETKGAIQLRRLARAAQTAAEKGDIANAETIAASVRKSLSNRFLKYRLKSKQQ